MNLFGIPPYWCADRALAAYYKRTSGLSDFRASGFSDFPTKLLNLNVLTITNHTLEKLETLLKSAGYKVRYEKGNFKTGACLLQASRMIVINKFSGLESKISAINELVQELDIDTGLLDDRQQQFLNQLKQTKSEL